MNSKILNGLAFIIMIISGITLCTSVLIGFAFASTKIDTPILQEFTIPTKKVELHNASYKPRTQGNSKDGYILTALSQNNEEYTVFMPVKPNIDKSQKISTFVKRDTVNLSDEPYYAFANKKEFENYKQRLRTRQHAIQKAQIIDAIIIIFSLIVFFGLMSIH